MLVHLDLAAGAPSDAADGEAGPSRRAAGHTMITARVEPDAGAVARRLLPLAIDAARIHFFDTDSDRAIYGD
jgi:hypothetical protein